LHAHLTARWQNNLCCVLRSAVWQCLGNYAELIHQGLFQLLHPNCLPHCLLHFSFLSQAFWRLGLPSDSSSHPKQSHFSLAAPHHPNLLPQSGFSVIARFYPWCFLLAFHFSLFSSVSHPQHSQIWFDPFLLTVGTRIPVLLRALGFFQILLLPPCL